MVDCVYTNTNWALKELQVTVAVPSWTVDDLNRVKVKGVDLSSFDPQEYSTKNF